jgi:hypothetical protein
LFVLLCLGILYRSYPHLFYVPRWIIEEEVFAHTIIELIKTGTTLRVGYQPLLEQYFVYFIYLATHINPTILCQYINPIIGGFTIFPVYFVLKYISTSKIAIIASTLWTFNENMIYRSSTFNSTEPLGFFFAIIALYSYLNIKNKELRKDKIIFFCGFLVFMTISIFTHILPAVFIFGVVSLDVFLKGSTKHKIIVILGIFMLVSFLYSPLNPHQTMMYSIIPSVMLSQFNLSNIFLYSISDILLGVSIFFGSIVLLILTIISIIIYKPKTQIMFIYLFGCVFLFIISWFFYSSYLIAPTRVLVYFILPLSYFSSLLFNILKFKKSIIFMFIVIIIMVFSSLNGINTMLYVNNTMTSDEYEFLDKSITVGSTYNFGDWWTDMPLKSSILLFSSDLRPAILPNTFYLVDGQKIILDLNSTKSTKSIIYVNGTEIILKKPPVFKYILLSPRMEKSAYFHVNTKYRTIQLNTPIVDIWKDLPDWKLVEEYKNIKIYKWIETYIEG